MSEIYKFDLPEQFVCNIKGLHGAHGEKWLADLPNISAEISRKWSLKFVKTFPNLTFNLVAACVNEKRENAVLKICVPEENPPIFNEKNALEAFGGRGAVRVLNFDDNLCAMLLERAAPGKTLREIFPPGNLRAVETAVDVMKKLPRQPPRKSEFPLLEEWTNDLSKARKTKFEPRAVEKARRIFADFRQPFKKRLLLHGDVHTDNIISAAREPFLLIDPKGCVGEIGFEIAVFLNDFVSWTNYLTNQKDVLNCAVGKFSEGFGLESKEIYRWAFAQAVLAAWWMFADFGRDWENYLACARMWESRGI